MPETEVPSLTTPLLGGSRQTSQQPLYKNLWLDYALLTQGGVLILVAIVWRGVFTHNVILFSGHPLLQSLGLLAVTQAILILQPTHEPEQKRVGQRAHAALNLTSFLLFASGVTIIEVNKIRGHGPHFHSVHGTLGILTSIAILLQYLVGFTIWAVPGLYGGVDKAKSLYKYHRLSGYFIYLALLATVLSAVWTDYNKNVLGIKWWQLVVPIALILPLLLRISAAKFGFRQNRAPGLEQQQ